MSTVLEGYPRRQDGVTIPAIAIWIVLSILLHVALLLWSPRLRMQPVEPPEPPSMTVFLQPLKPPEPVTPPVIAPAPPPVAIKPPPKPRPPRPPQERVVKPPPVIALDKPKPEAPTAEVPVPKVETTPAPAAPVIVAPTPPAPAETDLSAYVEARRRARGDTPSNAPAAEVERANRGALNSAGLRQPVPNSLRPEAPRNGYGSFDIRRAGYDYAEYMFRGWNENFRRNGLELIEVRQGTHSSIDLAVIRSIIGVIRRTENGDFSWYSHRLRKSLTLSARARDNAGLEAFMMQEFQEDLHSIR